MHGNECLSDLFLVANIFDEQVPFYDTTRKYGQSHHSLPIILMAIEQYGWDKTDFADYLLLDGIIGNTDRHHENWAWLQEQNVFQLPRLAPTFYHASSLGRELTDERRKNILARGEVSTYSQRAPGAIYWLEQCRNGPSPLQLIRLAVAEYPESFLPCLSKLSNLTDENILEVVNRIPQDWMTELQRTFAVELMKYNVGQLRELSDG